MGTVTRPRLLGAAFCLSLCGLGLTAGAQQLAQVAGPVSVIIDDGDVGYKGTNMTGPVGYDIGYNGDTSYFMPQKKVTGENSSARWTFTNLEEGTYEVYTTWGEHLKRTKKAEYRISENGTPVYVDQTQRPSSAINDHPWQLLGTATVGSDSTIVVVLKMGTDNITLADAVMVVKKEFNGICLTPVCAAPPVGCRYVPDSAEDANGCPLRPCGELKCEPTVPPIGPICGNGKIETGEECENDTGMPGNGCSAKCKKEYCGDGIVTHNMLEQCDDKNTANGDGCTDKCLFEYCGDGMVQASLGEACDDKNRTLGDGCDNNCQQDSVADLSVTVSGPSTTGRTQFNYTITVKK